MMEFEWDGILGESGSKAAGRGPAAKTTRTSRTLGRLRAVQEPKSTLTLPETLPRKKKGPMTCHQASGKFLVYLLF
jgi:hypothetical protein